MRWAIGALVAVGVLTHVVGLTHPRQVVFDEVHWGKSVTAYCCSGQRVFDVHPPHGKLLLTLGALAGGYDGSLSFETIGEAYGTAPVLAIRAVPALFGILIPPLFLLFLRGLGASTPTAVLGGILVALDNAILLETRLLLFDGILVAATIGSLVLLLAAERTGSRWRAFALNAGSGALAGLAVGTKFTGLAVVALIAIYLVVRTVGSRGQFRRRVVQALTMAGAAVIVYVGGWAIHFAVLQQPGPADAFHPTTGRFIEDFRVAHQAMLAANVNLAQTHPDASSPLSWPWMRVAPFFWNGPDSQSTIYLVGNPIVWWGSSVLFIVVLANGVLMKVSRLHIDGDGGKRLPIWLPLIGFAIAFLPFLGIKRVLFLYHYLTPLLLALAVVLLWLERAGWVRPETTDGARGSGIGAFGLGGQRASYYAVILAALFAFLLVSPVTYGFSLGNYDEALVRAVRSLR